MKKILASLALTAALIVTFAANAFAAVKSVSDINSKMDSLNQLGSYDFHRFINKSDLIGERLQNYNMLTAQYQNNAIVAEETMRGIINQINVLSGSSDISDMEKTMQITKLLQEADTALYDIDSKTIQYLYSVRPLMPTLTYQKYSKKFKEYYNELKLTNSKIVSK